MPDLLVVFGDRRRIAAAQAVVDGANVRWTGAWSGPWPEGVSAAQNPKAAGEWLRSQWSGAGLTAKSVVVVMPREEVVLRHLELPAAPDEELADLVRFQAAARSAIPIDQASLDFIPLPAVPSRPGRDVLAATVSNTVIESFRATLKAADRDLVGVTFSSPALAEWTLRHSRRREAEVGRAELSRSGAQALMASLTRRGTDPGHAELTLVVDGPHVEIVVVAERQLIFGHAARIAATAAEEVLVAIQAEVSRTMVAAQRLRPDLRLHHGWLVAGTAPLAKSLQEQMGCPVELIETIRQIELGECPTALRKSPGDAALLAGAILARATGAAPNVDFLHPRKPPPKRDPRKQKIAVAAAAAMLTLFVLTGGILMRLRSLDLQIAELNTKAIDYDRVIRGGQRDLAAATIIGDWEARNIPQSQQLLELEQALPGGLQRPYFSNYKFNTAGMAARGEALANITMTGAAKTREDVELFQQQLFDLNRYQVKPSGILNSRDDDYPSGFKLDVAVVTPKKSPVAPATPAKK